MIQRCCMLFVHGFDMSKYIPFKTKSFCHPTRKTLALTLSWLVRPIHGFVTQGDIIHLYVRR